MNLPRHETNNFYRNNSRSGAKLVIIGLGLQPHVIPKLKILCNATGEGEDCYSLKHND